MSIPRKLAALFRWRKVDDEMSEEMQAHLELQTEEYIARGMDPAEARRAAVRSFGGIEQVKERCRDERAFVWVSQLRQDLAYALRSVRKQPGFTAMAVLTLAIGIGINAFVFSLINDLMRPYVGPHAEGLVAFHTRRVEGDHGFRAFNYREFMALRGATNLFDDVAAMEFATALIGPSDHAQRRFVTLVSGNYFSILGVQPIRGRFFSAAESDPAANPPVAVASYELWKQAGAREDFIGSRIRIDRMEYTIIGVVPEGFGGLHWSIGPDAWLPLGAARNIFGLPGSQPGGAGVLEPKSYGLQVFGVLKPGLTVATASGMLGPLSARLNAEGGAAVADRRELSIAPPPRTNWDITWPSDESGMKIYATAAAGMTFTVLLVACVNIANMLLGRGVSRQKEIAIRLCLGASRGRIIRQLLVEGFLLAILGGAVGLLASNWAYEFMTQSGREHTGMINLTLHARFDWVPLLATMGLCVLATVVFALVPAIRVTRRNLVDDFKQQPGDSGQGGRWNRFFSLRHCLVMVQMALSVTLLFTSGVLVHAVWNTERDRGFETDREIVANLDYHLVAPSDLQVRERRVLDRVRGLPGVASAALSSAVPFNFEAYYKPLFPIGGTKGHGSSEQGDGGSPASVTVVSRGYFETLGIALLRGRDFTEAESVDDKTRSVVVIDESLGRTLFGEEDPIGHYVVYSKADADAGNMNRAMEVVGVVRSPREDAFQGSRPFARIYVPFGQTKTGLTNMYIHARVANGVAVGPAAESLHRELRDIDPQATLLACGPLSAFIERNLNVWSLHLLTALFAVFGLVAMVLAIIGIYGVKAYVVARRTREIGIRIAIGARPGDVLELLLRQSLLQTVVGLGVGATLAVLVGQVLSKILYRVSPADGTALWGAAALVGVASIVACLIPTLRAMAVKPTEALRTE